MKSRGYNFGAGPAGLPEPILLEAQGELLNWQEKGMSILEIGHRTPDFVELLTEARQMLRELLNVPDNYQVLFLGSPARAQFSMLPMNLLSHNQQAGFLITGIWSSLAFAECQKIRRGYAVASSEANGFTDIPSPLEWKLEDNTRYIHYASNETINGVAFAEPPCFGDIPLVVDMTSSLLSEPLNVSDYGVIFAGAQKNIAPAGLTLVIIREDLLADDLEFNLPTMLDYHTHIKHDSLYATLPTFNCYMAYKMFNWIKEQGGVEKLHEINLAKANKLYEFIDNSEMYHCKVVKSARSLMNVCFNLARPELEAEFLTQSAEQGLLALKGHRTVGGLRASLYNSMPMAGVDALIDFMQDFANSNPL